MTERGRDRALHVALQGLDERLLVALERERAEVARAHRLGGTLEVHSLPEKGTRVVLTLPVPGVRT